MGSSDFKMPNTWPVLPDKVETFEWIGESSSISWILKNRKFLFVLQSCLCGKPNLPHLLLCRANDGKRRSERFRVVDYHFAGRGFLSRYTCKCEVARNTVFVVIDLVRVEKAEYEFLKKEGPNLPRGRRPDPVLRVEDFASIPEEKAALTHWLQNPRVDDDVPYFRVVKEILPEDLCNACMQLSVANNAHPFAANFQMNTRLLAHDRYDFTFIDLFAGIGGFRLAMQQEGGLCTFASEIDGNARKTYRKNFGIEPFGDITSGETKAMIPRTFDILCGGFPCQAFSMAGKRDGFEDKLQRGTLYRQIVEIARVHQPKAIFCENVKGLLSSAEGRALQVISDEIEQAGYHVVFDTILDSMRYGVPQHRERLYIVALRNDLYDRMCERHLAFPARPDPIPGQHPRTLGDVLEEGPVSKSYYLGQDYLETLIRHRARHADTGESGFGYIVRDRNEVAGTLMCGGMGRERNMIHDENQPDWEPTPRMHGGLNNQHLRFLTVREWARLQGFPDYFSVPESIQAGYKQFGNCVTVKTVRAVGRAILNLIGQCEAEVEHE